MRWLLVAIIGIKSASCGTEEAHSDPDFSIKKKKLSMPDEIEEVFYSQYLFKDNAGVHEDVEVLLKIEVVNGVPQTMIVNNVSYYDPTEVVLLDVEESYTDANGVHISVFSGEHDTAKTGGKYTGKLITDRGNRSCCGEMTFEPQDTTGVIFTGQKVADLTADEWRTATQQTVPDVVDYDTKKVGEVFSITTDIPVRRVEAQTASGEKVEKAIAEWRLYGDIHDISWNSASHHLFFTREALGKGITKIVAYNHLDEMVLEADMTVVDNDNDVLFGAGLIKPGGGTTMIYSAVRFAPHPASSEDAWFYFIASGENGIDVSSLKEFEIDGTDSVGIPRGLSCTIGEPVFARVDFEKTVYETTCEDWSDCRAVWVSLDNYELECS